MFNYSTLPAAGFDIIKPVVSPGWKSFIALVLAASACTLSYAQPGTYSTAYAASSTDDISSEPIAFSTTGTIAASEIGNGVWWRPELDETSITLMLENLNEWEIKNLYVDVFRSGETLFPSQVLPQRLDATDRDWLQYIIAEAHENGIRVHAWAQVLCWHEPDADAASTHPLLLKNPNWVQTDPAGQVMDGKSAARFVSPDVPEVRTLLTRLTDELCRYPIDGLNLDSLHYNHRLDAGYTSASMDLFIAEHGIDPREIERDMSRDSDWMKWVNHREDQLTSVVQLISERNRLVGESTGRRVLLSVAVEPAYETNRGINRRYQHWKQWIEEGLVDATMPQCFNPDLSGLERQLWEARSVHMGSRIACIPGLLLDSEQSGSHPSLNEQQRLLKNTGFQYFTVMDYQGLVRAKAELEESPDDDDDRGFWHFLRRRDQTD